MVTKKELIEKYKKIKYTSNSHNRKISRSNNPHILSKDPVYTRLHPDDFRSYGISRRTMDIFTYCRLLEGLVSENDDSQLLQELENMQAQRQEQIEMKRAETLNMIESITSFYDEPDKARELLRRALAEQGSGYIREIYPRQLELYDRRLKHGTKHSVIILENEIDKSELKIVPPPNRIPENLEMIERRLH